MLFVRQRPSVAADFGGEVRELARRGSVRHAVDGHGDVFAVIALTDAVGGAATLRGLNFGHAAGDGDGTARIIFYAATDAGTTIATGCRDGAAGDGDGTARIIFYAATDAGTTIATGCRDGAAADGDVAASALLPLHQIIDNVLNVRC